ncbi:uncharacterized protein LOC119068259 [Bradysia coprophila]|uniref:uncharacterized protein LOC119068259 n=1 Tax=Bradysia coprophila TaxID=38358 RepID=UPI00187DC25D|nr:uncharacterized protein LOC119068259 [Bradysia coprophila]
MKFSTIIPFFSCITIATCYQCKWTACEGRLMNGDEICGHYGYAVYTGKRRRGDCNWDAEEKLCCSKPPPVACKWSSCEGIFKSGNDVCGRNIIGHYTGRKIKSDCKWDSARMECCDKAPMSLGCKWVPTCLLESYESREAKCANEFGAEYMPTRTLRCANLFGVAYECCPSNIEQEENLVFDETH